MGKPISNLRIVSVWAEMYADWEEGKQVSPSSDDLTRVACEMWGVPDVTGAEGDAFEEVTQDSTSLEEQCDFLAALIDARTLPPPDPENALTFDEAEAAGLDGTLRNM